MKDITAIVATLFAIIAGLSGVLLGWTGRSRDVRKALRCDTASDQQLRADVGYLVRGVDEIRLEQKSASNKIDQIGERVTRVEESIKSAHKRIDEMKGTNKNNEE